MNVEIRSGYRIIPMATRSTCTVRYLVVTTSSKTVETTRSKRIFDNGTPNMVMKVPLSLQHLIWSVAFFASQESNISGRRNLIYVYFFSGEYCFLRKRIKQRH